MGPPYIEAWLSGGCMVCGGKDRGDDRGYAHLLCAASSTEILCSTWAWVDQCDAAEAERESKEQDRVDRMMSEMVAELPSPTTRKVSETKRLLAVLEAVKADLTRARELQAQAEDSASRAISRAARMESSRDHLTAGLASMANSRDSLRADLAAAESLAQDLVAERITLRADLARVTAERDEAVRKEYLARHEHGSCSMLAGLLVEREKERDAARADAKFWCDKSAADSKAWDAERKELEVWRDRAMAAESIDSMHLHDLERKTAALTADVAALRSALEEVRRGVLTAIAHTAFEEVVQERGPAGANVFRQNARAELEQLDALLAAPNPGRELLEAVVKAYQMAKGAAAMLKDPPPADRLACRLMTEALRDVTSSYGALEPWVPRS